MIKADDQAIDRDFGGWISSKPRVQSTKILGEVEEDDS